MLGTLLFVAVALSIMQEYEGSSFTIAYMTMVCGMLVLNTISVDEFDKSVTFLMTMPIDRTIYAKEKYVFSLVCSLFGWLASTLLCIVLNGSQAKAILIQAAAIFVILSVFQMAILPVQLKFGGEKGRMVLLGIIAFLVLFFIFVKKIGGEIQIDIIFGEMVHYLNSGNKWIFSIGACSIWFICFILSLSISKEIMKKKEF